MTKRASKGEGTLYYDNRRKKYTYRYYVKDSKTGKVSRKCITADTLSEIKKIKNRIMYEQYNNTYIFKNGIPLTQLIKTNIEKKKNANIIRASQYKRLQDIINMINKYPISQTNIDEITTKDLQDFFNSLIYDYADSTIDKVWSEIKNAYKTALKENYITKNLMEDDIIKPKSKKKNAKKRGLTVEEQKILSDYLMNVSIEKEPLKNLYLCQMYLGLRSGEARGLREKNFNFKDNTVKVENPISIDENGDPIVSDETKTPAGKRTVPIPNILNKFIQEQLEVAQDNPDKMLFLEKRDKKLLRHNNVNDKFKDILKKLGIYENGLTTHTLRHTFATRCIEAGVPAVVVQKLLGHADIKVTLNTYTSVFEEYQNKQMSLINNYYKTIDLDNITEPTNDLGILLDNETNYNINDNEKDDIEHEL